MVWHAMPCHLQALASERGQPSHIPNTYTLGQACVQQCLPGSRLAYNQVSLWVSSMPVVKVRMVGSATQSITVTGLSLPYSGLLAEVDRALALQGKRVSIFQGGNKVEGDQAGRVQLEDGGMSSPPDLASRS